MLRPTLAALLSLLSPLLCAAPASAQASLPAGMYPVLNNPGTRAFAVIHLETQPEWSRGRVRLERREGPTLMTRPVRMRSLPTEVRAQLRGTVRVSSNTAEVCRARLGRPRVLRHVDAGWEVDRWNGLEGEPRYSNTQVAAEAWAAAEGFEVLVAPLIRVRGNCATGRWATRSHVTFGQTLQHAEPALLEAFRALEDYGYLAEGYQSLGSEDGQPLAEHWDARANASFRQVRSFVARGRRFSLIAAEAEVGCGDFTGGMWALFEHGPDGLVLVDTQSTGAYPVGGLADLDGDGVPEVLSFRRIGSTTTGETVDVNALFLGCPC